MKKLFCCSALAVVLLLGALGLYKGGELRGVVNRNRIELFFNNKWEKVIAEAEGKVANLKSDVDTAKINYAKAKRRLETTMAAKAKSDAQAEGFTTQLKFLQDRVASGKEIHFVNGKTLSESNVDAAIKRCETGLNSSREVSALYEEECKSIKKQMDRYEEFCSSGPIELEAQQIKVRNLRETYEIERSKIDFLGEDASPRSLKEAVAKADDAIENAKISLGIGSSRYFDVDVDFRENEKDDEETKRSEQLSRLNAILDSTSVAVDDSNAIDFE